MIKFSHIYMRITINKYILQMDAYLGLDCPGSVYLCYDPKYLNEDHLMVDIVAASHMRSKLG